MIINALMFNEDYISLKYHDNSKTIPISKILYYSLKRIALTSLIGTFICFLLPSLFISSNDLKKLFNTKSKQNKIMNVYGKLFKLLRIKITLFLIMNYILGLLFIYYICCFLGVYKYSQLDWIISSLLIFIINHIIPIILTLFISGLRIISIRSGINSFFKLGRLLAKL